VTAPPPNASVPAPASVGRRVAATLIDLVPLLALFALLAYTIGEWDLERPHRRIALRNEDFLLYLALVLAYYGVLEAAFGRTLGKAMLRLRVVRLDGSTPTTGQVAKRTLMRLLDFLPAFYLVGFVAAIANERNARLGDLVADTAVVAD
jgi:uncharacterized RDD family membrane protein YckC